MKITIQSPSNTVVLTGNLSETELREIADAAVAVAAARGLRLVAVSSGDGVLYATASGVPVGGGNGGCVRVIRPNLPKRLCAPEDEKGE